MTAAIFNLNHPANTVHWHSFSLSVSNGIVLMVIVFAVAILAPFPSHGRKQPPK